MKKSLLNYSSDDMTIYNIDIEILILESFNPINHGSDKKSEIKKVISHTLKFMKKILLLVLALLFCLNVFCQHLTLKDILNMENGRNFRSYLTSKSFVLTNNEGNPQFYYLNKGTKKEEGVVYETRKNGILYVTRDLKFLNTVLKDVKSQFHLLSKNDNDDTAFYSFDGKNLSIYISIDKTQGSGSISVSQSDM